MNDEKSTIEQIKVGSLLKAKTDLRLKLFKPSTQAAIPSSLNQPPVTLQSLFDVTPHTVKKDDVVLVTSIFSRNILGKKPKYSTTVTLYFNEHDYVVEASDERMLHSVRTLYAMLYRLFDVIG